MNRILDRRKNNGIERREKICGLLMDKGYLDVSELSQILGVNAVTIRRDLDQLESSGLLRRSHGGAHAQPVTVGAELDFSVRLNYHAMGKALIAQQTAALIEEGDTVYLDAGTTTLMVAEQLTKTHHSLTVVTNSLEIAQILKSSPGINLFVIGGYYLPNTRSMVGSSAEQSISDYCFRKMILATAGIDFRSKALTLSSIEEVPIKRAAIVHSEQVILVADQSKYNKPALISMLPLSNAQILVSDAEPSPEAMAVLENLGIKFILAHD